ncbi:MAG: hypothetical protein R2822_05720 [Spirosomataceae bacterium]
MKKIFYITTCIFALASCSILDQPPLDRISNDQYWKTPNDLENYTLQFYANFPTFRTVGGHFLGTIGNDAFTGSDHQITKHLLHKSMEHAIPLSREATGTGQVCVLSISF